MRHAVTRAVAIGLLAMLAGCGSGSGNAVDSDDPGEAPNAAEIANLEAMAGPQAAERNTGAPIDNQVEEDRARMAPLADNWIGDWTGVEGTKLTIARDPEKGTGYYKVTDIWGLDPNMRGTFDAIATPSGIAFTRPDGPQQIKRGDGKATGMKWLAAKKDCLVVKAGEGYCRD